MYSYICIVAVLNNRHFVKKFHKPCNDVGSSDPTDLQGFLFILTCMYKVRFNAIYTVLGLVRFINNKNDLKMKMYKTGGWKELIEVIEPIKVTEKSVWLSNVRNAKRSNYGNYWDTLEEAKEHLTEKYNRMIESSERKIEKAKTDLEALSKY